MSTGPVESSPVKGILIYVAAWQVVPVMDVIAKWLVQYYPVGQVVWARFFFHFLFVAPIVLLRYGSAAFRVQKPGLQLIRGSFLLGATALFFAAIRHIPLANAIALVFVAPILVTALSPVVLREKLTAARITAVLAGFAAVLVIVRPGFAGFHWASLLALGTAVCFAGYLLSTRALSGSAPPLVTLAWQSLAGLAVTSALLPWFWTTPAPVDLVLFAAVGAVASIGHFMVIKAFEFTDASRLAPFNYTEIFMATALGYLVFGDIPDGWTWAGITMIVGTAVYISLPERRPGTGKTGPWTQ